MAQTFTEKILAKKAEWKSVAPGQILAGPAIVEQLDATVVIEPGDVATVDAGLNLFIEVTS